MTMPAKFLFDNDFEEQSPMSQVALSNLEKQREEFEVELTTAKQHAYSEGFEAGEAEASKRIENELSGTLKTVAQGLEKLFSELNVRTDAQRLESLQISTSIAQTLCGELLDREPTARLLPFLEETVRDLSVDHRLTITVSDAVRERLEAELKNVFDDPGLAAVLTVKSADDMPVSDAVVEWREGEIHYRPSDVARQVDEKVREFLTGLPGGEAAPDGETIVTGPGETHE